LIERSFEKLHERRKVLRPVAIRPQQIVGTGWEAPTVFPIALRLRAILPDALASALCIEEANDMLTISHG
jgi:hypothetical protein